MDIRSLVSNIAICFLFTTIPTWASGGVASQIIINGPSSTAGTASNIFLGLAGDRGGNATEANRYCLASTAGTLTDLRFQVDTDPGAGNSRTATVFQNTVSTSLACTITGTGGGTAKTCTSAVELTVAAGDRLDVKFTVGGTPTNARVYIATRFLPTTATESIYCGGGSGLTLSTTATEYVSAFAQASIQTTEANAAGIIPGAGTVAALYVFLGTAPGGSATRDFTIMLNGVAQSMTCNVGSGATTCNTTANAITIAAGDTVSVRSVPNLTPAASTVKVGILFRATTNGEYFVAMTNDSTFTNTASTFNQLSAGNNDNSATEADVQDNAIATTVKSVYASVQTGPAAGKTWAFNFRQNSANAGPSCTISNPATTCNNSTTLTLSTNDLIAMQVAPSGTPTATIGMYSVLFSNTPRRIW